MQLSLEGIIETTLVGAIAALCVLTLLFLFVPEFIRVDAVWRLFRFLFYENKYSRQRLQSRDDATPRGPVWTPGRDDAADAGGPSERPSAQPEGASEMYRTFATLLIVAAVYGFGIIAESFSAYVTTLQGLGSSPVGKALLLFSDPKIRIDAFDSVGASALETGNTPPEFAEFMADYAACRSTGFLEHPRLSPTCHSLHQRARAFYFQAKNVVYRDAQYFDELIHLQHRINFTRGVSQSLMLLSALLGLGCILGTFAEALSDLRESAAGRARPGSSGGLAAVAQMGWSGFARASEFVQFKLPVVARRLDHWTYLAVQRVFLMMCLFTLAAWVSLQAWRNNEKDFDLRVFGYYLSSIAGQASPASGGDDASGAGPTSPATAAASADDTAAVAKLPRSSYRVFRLPAAKRFEPSAVAALKGRDLVIVANDKGDPRALSIFSFAESSGLTYEIALPLEDYVGDIGGVESLDAEPEGSDYRIRFATDFGADDDRRIVSFRLHLGRHPTASAGTSSVEARIDEVEELDIEPPCELADASGACEIEGMAFRGDSMYLGVRRVGRGEERRAQLVLLWYKWGKTGWLGTKQWSRDLARKPPPGSKDRGPFADSGISALEFAGDGSLLLLTSIENEAQPGTTDEVRGALWRIPRDEIDNPDDSKWSTDLRAANPDGRKGTYLVNVFIHKPEGIAVLDNESMLILFDDDESRKSRLYAPHTFALDQNQSVFSVVRPLPRQRDDGD